MAVRNPPERKLAKPTSVHCSKKDFTLKWFDIFQTARYCKLRKTSKFLRQRSDVLLTNLNGISKVYQKDFYLDFVLDFIQDLTTISKISTINFFSDCDKMTTFNWLERNDAYILHGYFLIE